MSNHRAIASGLGLILLIVLFGLASRWERSVLKNTTVNSITNETTMSKTIMQLTSSQIITEGTIPQQFTCDGADQSPDLAWSDFPETTEGFVLVVHDPDAPAGDWLHWLVINIPVTTISVVVGEVPTGGAQVLNDFGKISWGGPCPPNGSHRYYFEVYALDVPSITATTYSDVTKQLQQHSLAKAELMARYERSK